MLRALDPFRFLLITVAGWMNQHQLLVIDYLREENRILREQLGGRRLRFTDGPRRRLAAKAKGLGRTILAEVATIVTPETRALLASKADRPEVCHPAPSAPGRHAEPLLPRRGLIGRLRPAMAIRVGIQAPEVCAASGIGASAA